MTQSEQLRQVGEHTIRPITVFYTSICANYLGKALTLASSVKRSYPKSIFIIGLVERDLPRELNVSRYVAVDSVVLARELMDEEQFNSWVFRYSIVEAATAIKGALLQCLYQRYTSADYFFYLDPDIF